MACSHKTTLFNLQIFEEAFQEYDELQHILDSLELGHLNDDCWTWKLVKNVVYSAKKYYDLVHQPIISNHLLDWIWRCCCTLNIKVFVWLVIMDKLNTKGMLI